MLTHEEVFWREKGFDSKKDSPPEDNYTDRHNYHSSYSYARLADHIVGHIVITIMGNN